LLLLALATSPAQAQRAITVASTTSTEQSGLFKHILPKFTGSTGIEVRVVALGTGQALDIGRRGDADVVFVHDKEAEEKFVADGFGVTRREVMYNDFVVVGPKSDPAGAAGKDIQAALQRIAAAKGELCLARRPLGDARGGTPLLEGCRPRPRVDQGRLVQGNRPRHGACA
jgi:tungstate transport system substrate-binding protein